MRKQQRNRSFATAGILLAVLVLMGFNVIRKNTISITSSDGLRLTADEYIIASDNPYILLFHEQQSSRGEYNSIARKLCKMDYNCLAVDLRNGGNDNFVSNETVKRCRDSRCPTGADHVEKDIQAAIEYAFGKSGQPVVLLGSCANASLSLKVARENDHVRAVVAFSPGEYFMPQISIQDTIAEMKKPVFVTSSLSEFPYVSRIVEGLEEDYVTLFEPKLGDGGRGTVSLTSEIENSSEYWLALLLFFKDLV